MKNITKHSRFIWSVSAISVVIGLFYIHSESLKVITARGPASAQGAALEKKIAARKYGKGTAAYDVTIEALGKRAGAKIYELEATVWARSDTDDVKFNWILPEGTEAVSGPLEGALGSLRANEPTTLRLTVSRATDQVHLIHFHVYSVVNGENLGFMAHYNSSREPPVEAATSAKGGAQKLHVDRQPAANRIHY